MKELSIEQKAKAYDEAIDRAKKWHNAPNVDKIPTFGNRVIEEIFPELRESEDERIRKELIQLIGCMHDADPRKKGWLAWLEKQSEQKPQGKTALETVNEENADNANKVEPKFHKDEWITNGDYTWKIVEVKPLDYILQSQDGDIVDDTIFHVDEQFHSFTIQDVKDGDLIYVSTEVRSVHAIFHKFKDGIIYFHCNLCRNFMQGGYEPFSGVELVCPLQHTHYKRFFQKIKEAGYKWDAEKKELKKIDNEIETPFGAKDSELQEATYYIPVGFHAEIDDDKVVIKKGEKKPTDEEMKELLRTEYEKGRADAIAETQVAWSEEDEKTLDSILNDLRQSVIPDNEDIDWLKDLKQRITNKQ